MFASLNRFLDQRAERRYINRCLTSTPPLCPECNAFLVRRDAREYPNYRAPKSKMEVAMRVRVPEYGYECRDCDTLYSGRETYRGVIGEYVGPLSKYVKVGEAEA